MKDTAIQKQINTYGASCDQSSARDRYQFTLDCKWALDASYATDFSTLGEGVGTWISVNMPRWALRVVDKVVYTVIYNILSGPYTW